MILYCSQIKQEGEPTPDISQIAVLSLGTGSALPNTEGLQNAGALRWLVSGALIGTMMDGTSNYLQAMVDNLYHRLQNTYPEQYVRVNDVDDCKDENSAVLSAMDDPKNVEKLMHIGQDLGDQSQFIIRDFFDLCMPEEPEIPMAP